MTKFNINHNVKVKLTEAAVEHLRKRHNETYSRIEFKITRDIPTFKRPVVDDDGYCTFQLWVLMSIFGDIIQWGNDLPFETEIFLDIKE
jgi:hypothetical protein